MQVTYGPRHRGTKPEFPSKAFIDSGLTGHTVQDLKVREAELVWEQDSASLQGLSVEEEEGSFLRKLKGLL